MLTFLSSDRVYLLLNFPKDTITRVKYLQNRHFQDDSICLAVPNHAHAQYRIGVNAPQSLQAAEPNVHIYER